jgi:hypothetical protein
MVVIIRREARHLIKRESGMNILSRLAVLLVALVSLTACAGHRPSPAAGYNFIHRDFDFRYAWNTAQTEKGVSIDGLIKNVRSPRVEQVEIDVSLLNKSRQVLAKSTTFLPTQAFEMDEYRRFGVQLKDAKISGGDLLQFLVHYTVAEGQSSFSWTSSFTVDAITGTVAGRTETYEDPW